jgi:hypothetical protein
MSRSSLFGQTIEGDGHEQTPNSHFFFKAPSAVLGAGVTWLAPPGTAV